MESNRKYQHIGILKDLRLIFVISILSVLCSIPKESNSVHILTRTNDETFYDKYMYIRPSLKSLRRSGMRNFSLSHTSKNDFTNDFGPSYSSNFQISRQSCVIESKLIRPHNAKEIQQVKMAASAIRLSRSLGCISIVIQPQGTGTELLAEDQESLSLAFSCNPRTKKNTNETAYIWTDPDKNRTTVMDDIHKILSKNPKGSLTLFSPENLNAKNISASNRLIHQSLNLEKSDLCKSSSFGNVHSDGSPFGQIAKGLSQMGNLSIGDIESQSRPLNKFLIGFVFCVYASSLGVLSSEFFQSGRSSYKQSKLFKANITIRKLFLLVILGRPDSWSFYWLPKIARSAFSSKPVIPRYSYSCEKVFEMTNIQTVIGVCVNGFHISSSKDRFWFGPISKYELLDLFVSRTCFLLWKVSIFVIFFDLFCYILGKLITKFNLQYTVFDIIEETKLGTYNSLADLRALCHTQ